MQRNYIFLCSYGYRACIGATRCLPLGIKWGRGTKKDYRHLVALYYGAGCVLMLLYAHPAKALGRP